jgi:hypothetical protein
VTADYAVQGPHFLDWKSLAEKGCVSMAAVPMFSCNRPVAVVCLASDKVRIAAQKQSPGSPMQRLLRLHITIPYEQALSAVLSQVCDLHT